MQTEKDELPAMPALEACVDLGPWRGTEADDGTLGQEVATEQAPADGVVLSTFHRAKGLQWKCVFVIGLSEGLVPIASARSGAALEEEQRLLYVAMTRAEDDLRCSWSSGSDDPRGPRRASRWLDTIEQARDELEREQAPADPEVASAHMAHLRSIVSRD